MWHTSPMISRAPFRVLGLLLVAVVASASCSATETVTVSDGVIASATVSARASVPTPAPPEATPAPPDEVATSEPVETDTRDDDTPAGTSEPVEADTTGKTGNGGATGDPACTYAGVDSFGDMQIEVVFTHPLDEQGDATVEYEVLDGSGDVLISSFDRIDELKPGEMVRMMIDTVTDEPPGADAANITCTIGEIEASSFGFETFAPQPGDTCEFVEVDSFGDIQVQIDVVSPLDGEGELAVNFALRGPGGVRFEDDVTFIDSVGAGQQSSTEVDTFTEFPAWVSEATFTCDILSIEEF